MLVACGMGRPEPCVLFAHTFVHSQLDEYVDEVIFAELIVITACEFIEQNVSSASPTVTLMGATSPPSFALEAFVHCEGETRFRRLCLPFLYSHSSLNVLEVEAVVTNHLVVRGSYRSLSLVIYGNTAEDLGQFNIEVDIDSTLSNPVCAIEGNMEDLPPSLNPTNLAIEEPISALKALSMEFIASDISVELRQFLHLTFQILELQNLGDAISEVVNYVVSVASFYASHCRAGGRLKSREELYFDLTEVQKKLLSIYKSFQHDSGSSSPEFLIESMFLESEADLATSKHLVNLLSQYFQFTSNIGNAGYPQFSQDKNVILWLSVALLLCTARESCFQFVNGDGMKQLGYVFRHGIQNSPAVTLLLLGVVEQATRHSIGCEGFLGWWPREDENVPSGISEGYNQLLLLLLQKQRHDVASLATYILHRMRFYEVASKYECAVLGVLGGLSAAGEVTGSTLEMLANAKLQLRKLLKLIHSSGPIEDPSPVSCASRSLILGETEGLLSYKATSSLITSSNCCFLNWDIDSNLLFLLKERGFLPLSAALLASSRLQSEAGHAMDLLVDIISSIEAILLSFLYCRSGLVFLLHDPEISTTVILALRGADLKKEESVPLRYASVLISKGFFCRPQEVGTIVETHLRGVNAIDRLVTSDLHSEEILWALWELCCLSRSDCGRQALLALGHFPEAVTILMAALNSVKELDSLSMNTGVSPLNLAIFHSAVEIFEVIVTDSSASSLGSWIDHAKELHSALHSSSPGSNRKDAPTRLLEWIDASIVYHRNGAMGLLRYAALLASGGDANLASTSILASDAADVENVVGDALNGSDCNIIDNLLRKPINETRFLGVTLRDSSIVQLTTAFRILAFISENSVYLSLFAVAAALYDEGAIIVIHAVLIDCRLMLERSSNNYDYLVDESTECNSTSDLLLERNREQSLLDLLISSLLLLINLLQRLKEAKEQHRNTKLLKVLLHLHREVSPKLAACAADLSYPYPHFALGFEAVCHLLVSALACWPVYGWTPGLFYFLLDSLHATSLLALGPKETCSLLFLLNDLMPEEGVWLWKNGMPMLTTLRKLAVGTILGPQKEREISWYLQTVHLDKLHGQLTPHLGKIAQIILHCAISTRSISHEVIFTFQTLVVIQDLLRVFIIRVACFNVDSASLLLKPMILWISGRLSEVSLLSDADTQKVYRLLDFLAILLEHPRAKMLSKALESCIKAAGVDGKQVFESIDASKFGISQLSWCIPVSKAITLLCQTRTSVQYPDLSDRHKTKNLTAEDCSLFFSHLLRLCKILPVGRELLECVLAFKQLGLPIEGRSALLSILSHQTSNIEDFESDNRHDSDGNYNLDDAMEWKRRPPLLCCWITLLRSIDEEDILPVYAVEAVGALSLGALQFCMDGKRESGWSLRYDPSGTDVFLEENIKYIEELTTLLGSKGKHIEYSAAMGNALYQVKEYAEMLLLLLQNPSKSDKAEDILSSVISLSATDVQGSSKMHKIADGSAVRVEDYNSTGFGDKFQWECPENTRDKFSETANPSKRKMPSLEGANRRPRGDNLPAENMAQSAFSRGSGPATAPSGPARRDTFRQRKPNTSRPPSMHVDDYVARERNVDGTYSSNVIAVPRVGSTSGRPPSIHVDEFMARQRERQNPANMAVSDAAAQVKTPPPENDGAEKFIEAKQPKQDLDDELQGIDIVFDGEESESDDKLPFPQEDDNLQQPASVIVEQSSPRSIVEETESDVNESGQFSHMGTPVASHYEENSLNEFSSRTSASRPEMPLTREASISSDRKYNKQSENLKKVPVKTSSGFDSTATASSSGYSPSFYHQHSEPSPRLPAEYRTRSPNLYLKNSPQHSGRENLAVGLQGFYDQKFHFNQPPLPPMPPPPPISPVLSLPADPIPSQSSPFVNSTADVQPSLPPGFPVPAEYLSGSNSCTSLASSTPLPDSKYARPSLSSPGGSTRPPPPLPPTPPPYSATLSTLLSSKTSTSHSSVYNQTSQGSSEFLQTTAVPLSDTRLGSVSASGAILNPYPPPLMPPFFSRAASLPINLYANSPTNHPGDKSSISHNVPIALSPIQSVQSLAQLQPLQPPQLPRPPQLPQHLRPPIPASPVSEQGGSLLQSPVQMQVQPLQMLQPPHVSPAHVVYYQNLQQESFSHAMQQQRVEHPRPQGAHQEGHGMPQQQDEAAMTLQHYFSSPEAIQSLLSDRDKLCQLLEQHPKLMQMLQERLGQL
ncbi:hypothetical protein RJ639_034184 [Escallonia herrerae]|uniref:Virilizer N-terminal domain-containing protein n=1 Tax=Escallonia herrerae TaxID=1293975 RepID=A0AA88WTM6_9ASTE|nr:hypothetical protein RJ639_034184 [Escallonia herrerae]